MIFTNHRMIVLFQLMCSLVGCHPYTSFSQYAQWFEKFGTNCNDNCYDFSIIGSERNILTIGDFSRQPSGTGMPCDSLPSLMIRKFDYNGNIIWSKYFHGTNFSGTSLATNNLKEIYISGWFTGTVQIGSTTIETNTPYANSNMFLLKCNSNGDFVWLKKQGSDGTVIGSGPLIGKNSNVYVSCWYANTLFLEDKQFTRNNGKAYMMIEYDPTGAIVRNKALSFEIGFMQNYDSKILCSGALAKSDTLDQFYAVPSNTNRLFIALMDTALQIPTPIFWATGYYRASITAIKVSRNNDIYVAGSFSDSLAIDNYGTIYSSTDDNRFFLKIGQDNRVKWVYVPDSSWVDGLPTYYVQGVSKAVAVDSFDNSYFCGSFNGILKFGDITLSQSVKGKDMTDVFVVGFNSIGKPITAFKMGGPGEDDCCNIEIADGRSILLAGTFADSIAYPNGQCLGNGYRDGFIGSFAAPITENRAANQGENGTRRFSCLFKNGHATIMAFGNETLRDVTITNLTGRIVFHSRIEKKSYRMDLSSFAHGIYLIHVDGIENKPLLSLVLPYY